MRHLAGVALIVAACGGPPCPVSDLADAAYCGGGACVELASLSEGCIGSHTEQACKLGSDTYVLVASDDEVHLYFDQDGHLVAERQLGEGDGDVCADAWYGLDLSGCEPEGEPETVPCTGQGE